MARCCICNKDVSRWIESEGKKFCSDECFQKSWPKCLECGKPMQQWLTYPGGKKFCSEECAKKSVWPKCHTCGKPMNRWQEDEHGHKYCSETCYSQSWPKCAVCGKSMKEWKVDKDTGIKYCSQECFLQACPTCDVCGRHMMSWKCYEDGKKYCSQYCLETRYPNMKFEELPNNYDCFDILFRDVETEGKKSGYIDAAQKYDAFLELLIKKISQVRETFKTSHAELNTLFESLCRERDSELRLRAPKIESLLKKFNKLKREDIMKQLEFNPRCPFAGITFSECCMPAVIFGLIGVVYSVKLAKLKQAKIAGWQDARKVWKKKIDKEIACFGDLINSGNKNIQEMISCILELLAYKIQNAELDLINED